jgi:hypothetical protein
MSRYNGIYLLLGNRKIMWKIRAGRYRYKGYIIRNHGYYPPDKCVWWEAINELTNEADYHAHTKKKVKDLIDSS